MSFFNKWWEARTIGREPLKILLICPDLVALSVRQSAKGDWAFFALLCVFVVNDDVNVKHFLVWFVTLAMLEKSELLSVSRCLPLESTAYFKPSQNLFRIWGAVLAWHKNLALECSHTVFCRDGGSRRCSLLNNAYNLSPTLLYLYLCPTTMYFAPSFVVQRWASYFLLSVLGERGELAFFQGGRTGVFIVLWLIF